MMGRGRRGVLTSARRGLFLAALFLNSSLLGCATLRRAREAQDPRRIPAGERTVSAEEAGLVSGMTLSLVQAEEVGRRYHPTVVRARQNLKIAESQAWDAIAGYLPTVEVRVSYRRATAKQQTSESRSPSVSSASSSERSYDSYSAGVSLDQLLADFGKTSAVVRQAQADKRAAEAELKAAENDAVYQVRTAYYEVFRAESLLVAGRETESQLEKRLAETRALFEAGRRIQNDVTRAEVDWHNAQLSRTSAENSLRDSRLALNRAMGLTEAVEYRILEPAREEVRSGPEELWKMVREKNPELSAKAAEEEAASAALDAAIAALFPRLSLGADYTGTGSKFPLVWNWGIGAALVWDLFNGFRNLNQVDQAAARLRLAHVARTEVEQRLYQELHKALNLLGEAREREALAGRVRGEAEENLRLVTERFRVGRATQLEVTDAHLTLTNSRADQVQAFCDYLSGVAAIKHLTGGET